MFYVYMLQSVNKPEKIYVGYTQELNERFAAHNNGRSVYTAKYRPWILLGYIAFSNQSKAIEFEKYLKSGSGKAFAQKHFL